MMYLVGVRGGVSIRERIGNTSEVKGFISFNKLQHFSVKDLKEMLVKMNSNPKEDV